MEPKNPQGNFRYFWEPLGALRNPKDLWGDKETLEILWTLLKTPLTLRNPIEPQGTLKN